MQPNWNDSQPIYQQLKDHAVAMILDGTLAEGDPLPSVRKVSAEFRLNPITVSRAYQELAEQSLVETRRGLGMFVIQGAREKLLSHERDRFLNEEWPRIVERIHRLDIDKTELLHTLKTNGH